MVAKVAGGIVGLGLIGTGSVAMAKPEWFGINKEIAWKPLSQDNGFADSNSEYKGKFGENYKNYLTGVKENEDWWKESFERLKKDSASLSDQFKFVTGGAGGKVTQAFDDSTTPVTTALNQVCKAVYKANTENIKPSPGSSSPTEYKDIDVWKYCSPVGAVPKTVQKQTGEISGTNTSNWIGKTKESELLSTQSKDNEKLWKLKNDEFFGTGIFTSTTPRTFDSEDKFFQALFERGNKGKDTLKNKCEAAYKSTSESTPSNENKTKDDHVVKYCSLKSIQ